MSQTATLTVTALVADRIDVTPLGGPPAIIPDRWVAVTATNGAITTERRVPLNECPHIGDTITVTIDDQENT